MQRDFLVVLAFAKVFLKIFLAETIRSDRVWFLTLKIEQEKHTFRELYQKGE